MARYQIRFLKNLCDDSGHLHKCVEGVIDISSARDSERAVQAAKAAFPAQEKIPRWDLYADTYEVEIEE